MTLPLHEFWMRRALHLAEKGRATVSPNPMVGACVVLKGKLVGSGFHEMFGGPHAEPNALAQAGRQAKGATLYVTLEPCATWQKTPPCAPLIKEKGIREVVVGCLDPNPLNHGRGVRFLRKHGIRVTVGVLESKVREQNEGFFKHMTAKRPFVTLKMAQTLDGKIATQTGLSRWVSSPASRKFVHELRAKHDAVLVGKNTFLKDDPLLAAPQGSKAALAGRPWKIVMTSASKWSSEARTLKDQRLTIAVFPEKELGLMVKKTEARQRSLLLLPVREKHRRIDVAHLLERLASLGINKLLVEGGGELAWSFLETGCVDRAYWVVAPKVFGGRVAKTSVEGDGVKSPDRAFPFQVSRVKRSGEDWIFEGVFITSK